MENTTKILVCDENDTERARLIENLYKALWAEKHIGEIWDATVSGITAFGLFAELSNTVEGLIPADFLPFGAFCDEENALLSIGRDSLRIADPVRIRIEEVSVLSGRIRFALLSS
jgi:ribonuclease R